jgi:subtilisin family serine protease
MRLVSLAAAIALALPSVLPAQPGKSVDAPVAQKASGRQSWILSFDEPAAPMFRGFQAKDGRHPALAAVAIDVTGAEQYDPQSPAAAAYLDYIGDLREQRLRAASALLGRELTPRFVYEHALNGVALDLDADEARLLEDLPGVRAVTRDFERFTQTDVSTAWIKAPDLWNGTAGVTTRGEGVIVGVIDSGINLTHPSFAATAGGFTHTNPRGLNVYVGWCIANPSTCNNKLIGMYDFVSGGVDGRGASGADPDGHGTHVASTAVGNPVSTTLLGSPVSITGAAPRANLIGYRGCGSDGTSRSCGPNSGTQLLASINQAIADRVDVINYSIGGSSTDPFGGLGGAINSDEEAFLVAREAGIIVVTSAGNEGPDPGTHSSPGNSPWVVSTASVTSNRNGAGDRLAASSSRGPVVSFGVIKPNVAAPGVQIRAAAGAGNVAASLSGTSMASPHVAGAAALLSAARPAWNADQVISALLLTARADNIVEQSTGAATTPHDRGAGTIDVAQAVNASLSFNVPVGQFRGGSDATSSTLNLPSLAAGNCVETCTLTRTVTAMPGTPGGQYQIIPNLPAGLTLSTTPATINVAAGGSQSIDFRFSGNAQTVLNRWAYGSVTLRRVGGGTPDLKLPVAIFQSAGTVPPLQDRTVSGDRGFVDFNLGNIISLPDARFGSTELAVPLDRRQALTQDSNNADPYDNLSDGVFTQNVVVNYNDGRRRTVEVVVKLAPDSTPPARDLDLFIGLDGDADALPDSDEERCRSISSGPTESCTLTLVHTGNNVPLTVWALVQNYSASGAGASNTAFLEMTAIDTLPSTRQLATGPGNVPASTDFTARLIYDDPTLLNGQSRYGFLLVDRGAGSNAIRVPFKLTRNSATPSPFAMGLGVDRSVTLPAGAAHDFLYVDVPAGATQLVATTQSAANVDLYLSRVEPVVPALAPPTIAAAPARSAAAASAVTGSGNETVTVANPAPGRWYLTPVNTTGATATAVVRATVTGTGPTVRAGGYFNPERGGHGLFVYPAGNQLAAVWFTYLQDGTPTWYYMQGDAPGANGFWRGVIVRTTWNGSQALRIENGSATISPTATNEFVFSYNIDGETGSEALRKFGGGCPNLAGSPLNVSALWFNPARSGSGYAVQMFPNYEFYAMFVFDGLGQPRFLSAEQPFVASASSTLSSGLLQNVGFCPLCTRTAEPTRTSIGNFSRSYAGGVFSNITLNGTYINGVPGVWTGNENVQVLGSVQGCAP